MTLTTNDNIILAMIDKITQYIKQYNMLEECERIVVGLSGGADSVCLLHVLHSVIEQSAYDIRLMAVHVNHGIRGEEAARDEEFAKTFCDNLGVDYVSERVNIPKLAKDGCMSEEEAGREVRYTVFAKYAGVRGKIAVAHHMDDQAETVLMNIFRGSGLKGVSGMAPVRGNIIRPLLCVTRQDIEDYIAHQGLSYVTDSTNSENVYTRNRVRNELIPYVKQNFNPEIVKHLASLAEEISQCDSLVLQCAKTCMERCVTSGEDGKEFVIDTELLVKEPYMVQSKVVMMLMQSLAMHSKDLYRVHVNAVLALMQSQVGKYICLPYGMKAVKTYDSVKLLIEEGTVSQENQD
ncbi:MAG: tRNA lysidine(34) synthetase TilS, partial [Lachnospira sp.]|nr:tRNA lysidine(34) synthetase TilS [Lachnospira sp.]